MLSNKFNLKSFFKKKDFKKFFWLLGRHIFSVIILMVFLELLFGAFLVYKYTVMAESQDHGGKMEDFKFDEGSYQNLLLKLQEREARFDEILEEKYANPFKSKSIDAGRPGLQ